MAIDKLKNARVLVLGGSGFIGKNLCRALVDCNAIVRCLSLDDPFDDDFLNDLRGKIEWVRGNFSDNDTIERALEHIDIVYHLISTTLPATSNRDPKHDLESNVISTLNLLEHIKGSAIKKIVFISSGGTIYGIAKEIPITEKHETQPICAYGIHKLAIEKYLHLYHHFHGLDYRIVRLANPYGKNQISERPQGVIGSFMHRAINGKPLEIWGDGKVVRDYIYIDDAVKALVSILDYEGSCRIFNIGSGKGYSLLDIIAFIETCLGQKLNIRFKSTRNFDLDVNVLDISLAHSEFGWKPETDIQTGIRLLSEYGKFLLVN